jgi:hypothetical protein
MLNQKLGPGRNMFIERVMERTFVSAAMLPPLDAMANAWKQCQPTGMVTRSSSHVGRSATLTTAGQKCPRNDSGYPR